MFKELSSLMSLLNNKDKIQAEMAQFQQNISQFVAEGSAGAGMVKVTVNGHFEMVACRIADDVPTNDREMLEDLIVAATNQAIAKVRELLAAESAKIAGNLGLPAGMMGNLFPGMGG
jgi:DNA-binding YbaB/EbfC family protein